VKIWRHAGRFDRSRGAPLAWIGVIARNAALDRLEAVGDARSYVDIEDEIVQPTQMDTHLMRCLNNLPKPRGEALLLMYIYGLTHQELADRLSAPLGTVKSWVRRGAIELREALEA
jgi:RNA polymerase sigma-70 factor (ECF subfamily)